MTEELKQIIQEEVIKLPKETQEAINSLDWAKITEEIGTKFLLTESEISSLQSETLLVLVGLENRKYFAQNIEDNVGISKAEAEKIAPDVNQKVLTPVRNVMEENIKKNLKNKNPNWQQSLNFILTGGNYAAFIEERGNGMPETSATPINPPPLREIRDNLVM